MTRRLGPLAVAAALLVALWLPAVAAMPDDLGARQSGSYVCTDATTANCNPGVRGQPMGVYNATPIALGGGGYAPLQVNARGAQYVQAIDASGNAPSYGTLAVDFTATSGNVSGTFAQTAVTGLGNYHSALFYANVQGATGGTLDVYLQASYDGSNWVDYAHFAQLSAGAAAVTKVFTVSKYGQQTTITAAGGNLVPALAANTVVGGDWGDRMRVIFVEGAGTSAGATQTIKAVFSA